MMKKDLPVIVIGAGLSGLCAAKLLVEEDVDVLVLEARNRVGGRTFTIEGSVVKGIDLGGSFVGPTQDGILRLAKECGVKTCKMNDEEDSIHYSHGRRIYYPSDSVPSFWNPLANMDLNHYFRILDEMGEEIPTDAPWNSKYAEEWDRITVKEFIEKTCWTSDCKSYVKSHHLVNMAAEAQEMSLLWYLWYIKQCGGTQMIHSISNGAQDSAFIGGSQQISKSIAEKIGEERILLNKPVVGLVQNDEDVCVTTLDGATYMGRFVIMAIPPTLYGKIQYSPPLSPLRNQMTQRMPMGATMKAVVYYRKDFWRNKNCCGNLSIDGGDEHPAAYIEELRTNEKFPALTCFVNGDKCRRLTSKPKEERMKIITRSIAEVLDMTEALYPLHYEDHSWIEEQYSGGGYTAVCPTGSLISYGRLLRKPEGLLHFAGTETATRWSGYMDGAVQAGKRCAREILYEKGIASKEEIYIQEQPSEDIVFTPFKITFYEKYMPSVPGFLKFISGTILSVLGLYVLSCKK